MRRTYAGKRPQRLRWAIAATASALILAACGGNSGGDGESFELVFNGFIPEAAHSSEAVAAWLDEIEENSDGRITFQRHWGGALADALEANDAMSQGRIDVGVNSLAYEPDQFYLTEGLLKIPYQSNDLVAVSAAISEMHEQYEEAVEEFSSKNLHMLAAMPTTPLVLNMTDVQVDSLEDLNGMTIRGAGEGSSIDAALRAVGSNVVAMPPAEVYTALQRGTIDGQMTFGFVDGPSWGIEEVTNHWIDPGIGPFAAPFLLMNQDTWEELPADLQDVIQEATDHLMTDYVNDVLPEYAAEACEAMQAEGVQLSTLSDEVQQEWADLFVDDFLADWKQRISDRGVDGEEYLAAFQDAVEANASDEAADQGAFLGCEN